MAPKNKKKVPPANAEIVREQLQLMQTKKLLEESLKKVKDNINKLMVEELELKSALVRNTQVHRDNTPKVEPSNPVYLFDSVHEINEQKLNLFTKQTSQSQEEYDED